MSCSWGKQDSAKVPPGTLVPDLPDNNSNSSEPTRSTQRSQEVGGHYGDQVQDGEVEEREMEWFLGYGGR